MRILFNVTLDKPTWSSSVNQYHQLTMDTTFKTELQEYLLFTFILCYPHTRPAALCPCSQSLHILVVLKWETKYQSLTCHNNWVIFYFTDTELSILPYITSYSMEVTIYGCFFDTKHKDGTKFCWISLEQNVANRAKY